MRDAITHQNTVIINDCPYTHDTIEGMDDIGQMN